LTETRVSIITVSLNSAATIRDTIESVLEQDYPHTEYIVVDGGSTDSTISIVREYGDRIDSTISEPDRGIYDAMNKGIAAATGDIVGFLNSDDIYAGTDSLRLLVGRLEEAASDCVFADLVVVSREDMGRVLRYYRSGSFSPSRLRYGWMPAHPTLLVKRAVYKQYGDYRTDYEIASDFEMVARLLYRAGVSYAYLPRVAVRMRAGGLSTRSLRSSWILNREIVRACRANGIETSLPRVLLKTPAKLMERIIRPGAKMMGA